MMVLAVSELCRFRASIPLTANIGDPDTFLRRSPHLLAIGAHVHICKHGPQQVNIVVTRDQMGVVREFLGKAYVPLRICRTLYARAMGDNIHSLRNSYFCVERFHVLRISCEVTVDCHFTGIITLPGSFLLSSMVS